MGTSKILKIFTFGLILHLCMAIGFLSVHAHLEPTQNVHLSTQKDAILIYGTNRLGVTTFRIFRNWSEAQDYMSHHHLKLPTLSMAEKGTDLKARLVKSSARSHENYYRIFWSLQKQHNDTSVQHLKIPFGSGGGSNSTSAAGNTPVDLVIHTPDSASALEMLNYIRFSKLKSSILGFSIPLLVVHSGDAELSI